VLDHEALIRKKIFFDLIHHSKVCQIASNYDERALLRA